MALHIVICEDDEGLGRSLRELLAAEGFVTRLATTGQATLSALQAQPAALLLLDLTLPDMDGLDVCRRLRQSHTLPVIIMSARGAEVDRIVGLEVGADDYLTKPFRMPVLLARVAAQLRRVREYAPGNQPAPSVTLGGLRLEYGARAAYLGDRPLHLTPTEFALLWALAEQRGSVVRARQLLARVWGHDAPARTRTLEVHIGRLRAKLEADPRNPQHLVTVPGVGYRLVAAAAPAPQAAWKVA